MLAPVVLTDALPPWQLQERHQSQAQVLGRGSPLSLGLASPSQAEEVKQLVAAAAAAVLRNNNGWSDLRSQFLLFLTYL